MWLKNWRIGRERGMGGPVDVEIRGRQCVAWLLRQARAHADAFLGTREAASYIAECEGKLARRRGELAEGRARNAEVDAHAARKCTPIIG